MIGRRRRGGCSIYVFLKCDLVQRLEGEAPRGCYDTMRLVEADRSATIRTILLAKSSESKQGPSD